MKTICIIPARGGSKGVPGKNIREVAGKALILHSLEYAESAADVDAVYVSTDDEKIAEISRQGGAEVIKRPAEIAGDTATTESAISHVLEFLEAQGESIGTVILLQATSPFRPEGSLQKMLNIFFQGSYDSMLSLSPTHRFFWRIQDDTAHAEYDFINRPRRQDMQEKDIRYVENGSVYIFSREHFRKCTNRLGGRIGYYIFDEAYAYEIDSEEDLAYLDLLMQKAGMSAAD